MTILAICPRELPTTDMVEVWCDAGSGATGQLVKVAVDRLTLSERDRGEGRTVLYEYESYYCRS
ncbi:hypothetical protein O7632_27435 [Solwaraspora sp. WMMD406]|uniref:hypothetical protein n=1 Tax=Solwaraspora sp. WMMD406 TaxID=3016095 RepID=UPI00241633A3|nr:hypothetical protein [Solwaraspora sp. WMMD406]MDG4767798.1 hypothetical protein [Solwaraspora sp. WMMD406]